MAAALQNVITSSREISRSIVNVLTGMIFFSGKISAKINSRKVSKPCPAHDAARSAWSKEAGMLFNKGLHSGSAGTFSSFQLEMCTTNCQNARQNKTFNKGGNYGAFLKPGESGVALAAGREIDRHIYSM